MQAGEQYTATWLTVDSATALCSNERKEKIVSADVRGHEVQKPQQRCSGLNLRLPKFVCFALTQLDHYWNEFNITFAQYMHAARRTLHAVDSLRRKFPTAFAARRSGSGAAQSVLLLTDDPLWARRHMQRPAYADLRISVVGGELPQDVERGSLLALTFFASFEVHKKIEIEILFSLLQKNLLKLTSICEACSSLRRNGAESGQ